MGAPRQTKTMALYQAELAPHYYPFCLSICSECPLPQTTPHQSDNEKLVPSPCKLLPLGALLLDMWSGLGWWLAPGSSNWGRGSASPGGRALIGGTRPRRAKLMVAGTGRGPAPPYTRPPPPAAPGDPFLGQHRAMARPSSFLGPISDCVMVFPFCSVCLCRSHLSPGQWV